MRMSISSWRSVLGVFCLSLTLMCASCSSVSTATFSANDRNFVEVCKTGTPEQVAAMIHDGADVNAKAEIGMTPLMFAADHNPNPDVIAVLLKAGADVNAKNRDGMTPLTCAAASNLKPDVIAALLKGGAEVNGKNKDGFTPLMFAALLNPNADVTTVLLKGGADVTAKDKDGKTALDYARAKNNSQTVGALITAAAKGATVPGDTKATEGSNTVEEILSSGPGGAEGVEMAQQCAEFRKILQKSNISSQEIEATVRTYAMALVVEYHKGADVIPAGSSYTVVRSEWNNEGNLARDEVCGTTDSLESAKDQARKLTDASHTADVYVGGAIQVPDAENILVAGRMVHLKGGVPMYQGGTLIYSAPDPHAFQHVR